MFYKGWLHVTLRINPKFLLLTYLALHSEPPAHLSSFTPQHCLVTTLLVYQLSFHFELQLSMSQIRAFPVPLLLPGPSFPLPIESVLHALLSSYVAHCFLPSWCSLKLESFFIFCPLSCVLMFSYLSLNTYVSVSPAQRRHSWGDCWRNELLQDTLWVFTEWMRKSKVAGWGQVLTAQPSQFLRQCSQARESVKEHLWSLNLFVVEGRLSFT